MTLVMKSLDGTTSGAGVLTVTFGDYEKVSEANVMIDGPNTTDYVFSTVVTMATNVVTITVYKSILTGAAGTGTWGAAATQAITGVVVADCI